MNRLPGNPEKLQFNLNVNLRLPRTTMIVGGQNHVAQCCRRYEIRPLAASPRLGITSYHVVGDVQSYLGDIPIAPKHMVRCRGRCAKPALAMSPNLNITSHDVALGPSAWGLVPRACGLGDQPISFLKTILALPCVLAGFVSYGKRSRLMCSSKVFCAVPKSSLRF